MYNFADQNINRKTVDYLKNYTIPFIGLPLGNHHFDMEFNINSLKLWTIPR